MRRQRCLRGAITVEAAITLPVFICIVMSLAMMIKLIYIHDTIQHAIDEASNELAAYAYMYHASDLQRIDDEIQDNLDAGSRRADQHFSTFIQAFDDLEQASDGLDAIDLVDSSTTNGNDIIGKVDVMLEGAIELQEQTQQLSETSLKNIEEISKALEEAASDPKAEMKSIAWLLTKSIYGEARNLAAVPLIRSSVAKHISRDGATGADLRLKSYHIHNGLKGLDFYSSSILGEDENIDIVVKYKVELPLPIRILPDIYIMQRSSSRAWLEGGDGSKQTGISIWELPNKERGMKIEELYGGNLPYKFPVIDIYDSSSMTGTSIKSINLCSESYQTASKLKHALKGYIDDLKKSNSIYFENKHYELKHKKMILVIPKGSVNDGNREIIEQMKAYASRCGIEMTVSELDEGE